MIALVLLAGIASAAFGTLVVAFHTYRISREGEVIFSGLFFLAFVLFQILLADWMKKMC